jgi:hypothetical protein
VLFFSITIRAVDSTNNADSVVEADAVPRSRGETVDRVWILLIFHDRAGEVQAGTSFENDYHVDIALYLITVCCLLSY